MLAIARIELSALPTGRGTDSDYLPAAIALPRLICISLNR